MNQNIIAFLVVAGCIFAGGLIGEQNQQITRFLVGNQREKEQSLEYDEYGFASNLGDYLVDD